MSNEERDCLFAVDTTSGCRKVVDKIVPNSVIGFMNATPWCGKGRDTRRTNALDRIFSFISTVCTSDSAPELDQVLSYASPEEIDVENTWARMAREPDLRAFQRKFVDKYLVPLVAEKNDEGTLGRLPLEQAKKNMRLTLVGFSYGGMFIAGVRTALVETMQKLSYSPEEIKDVCSQVCQVNFGVQYNEEEKLEPKFTQLNLVNKGDEQGIWESWLKASTRNLTLLENPDTLIRGDKTLTKAHSQEMYMQALTSRPEICQAIAANMSVDEVRPFQVYNSQEQQAFITERLGELEYKMQMLGWR